MLRVADGLDRSHRQHVRPVAIRCNPTGLRILVRAQGDGELEIWEARRRAMLLETCLGRSVTIETMAPGRRAGVARPVPGASGKRAATGRAPAPPSR
jgi:exopolyphosphatase/guanosine-5'-triphosphate,3'-diphosphate pyrophosphatase